MKTMKTRAEIVEDASKVWAEADMIMKVKEPLNQNTNILEKTLLYLLTYI